MVKKVSKNLARSVPVHIASLAAVEPWARFRAGIELAQSIERGREQHALWLLDDGVCPPAEVLGPALCVAARNGMSQLCERLLNLGANPSSYWVETPTLLGGKVDTTCGVWVEATHGCAALAMRGGHLPLAQRLLTLAGAAAIGPRGACVGSLLRAAAPSLRTGDPVAHDAFMMVAKLMPEKDWPCAAALLCSAGRIEMALWMLDASNDGAQLKMARAMLAPLCAYLPKDSAWAVARDALAHCVLLSAGKSAISIATSSLFEVAEWSAWGELGYDSRESRLKALSNLAWRSWDFPASEFIGRMACWPRVAALLCGNIAALELLKGLPFGREEREAVRSWAKLLLEVIDGSRVPGALPSFTLRKVYGRWEGASPGSVIKDVDEHDFARRALSLVESSEIESKISASKPRKMGKLEKARKAQEVATNVGQPFRFRL